MLLTLEKVVFSIFFGSVLLQLIYQAFIFSRLAFYKQEKKIDSYPDPQGVSVVVCARNELENLQKLIPALLNQQYGQFELIVVDDRSNDECYDFLLFESFKHDNMKLVRVNEIPNHMTPKKYALSLGIKAAKYEVVLLTDADCIPQSEHWISQMQQQLIGNKQIVLGYSPYASKKGFLNFMIRYETFYTAVQYFSFTLAHVPYMGVGRNLAYRKSLFLNNKGFRNHLNVLGGDDDLFINQVATSTNVAVCLEASSQMVSVPKNTFKEWYWQKKRHLSVGKYYKTQHKILLGTLSLSQVLFWVSFLGLVALQAANWIVLSIFLLRMLSLTCVLQSATKNIDKNIKWFLIPIFDLLYVVYYLFIGFSAFFSKQIRWN